MSPTLRALVVGGTSGIGRGIAMALSKRGDIEVVIAGRSDKRGAEIVTELQKLSPANNDEIKHSYLSVDAFDLKSVKKMAEEVTYEKKLDLLVMTQGMATIQGYTPTVDELDQKLQLHYFSRIYLAKLLAPKMASGSRILTVLSAGVHKKFSDFETDFDLKTGYSIPKAADAAGFYNDAGFEKLAKEFPYLVVCHAAPGFVNTNWGTEMPWYIKGMVRCAQPLGRSYKKCGDILASSWLDLPVEKEKSWKNFYLLNPDGKVISNGIRHSPEEADVIWAKTMDLLPSE